MTALKSYIQGKWQSGSGKERQLVNPATEEVLATATTEGLDMKATLDFARTVGGTRLRSMSIEERGQMLAAMAAAIHEHREELLSLATANGGNTRGDAKFDVDGASGTLAAYGKLAEELGEKLTVDGEPVQVGRTQRLQGQHIWVPRTGTAVLINAFNFPAWGLAEKAGCALLAGMPIIAKPATATALVTHRLVEILVESSAVPEGVLSLLCGSVGDMFDHLNYQDVVSFTGSSTTGNIIRGHKNISDNSVHTNVEADSLNSAVIGPDVSLSTETGQLALRDIVRDMTQKAGQKCTAIRRILIPASLRDELVEELTARLDDLKMGDPSLKEVRMGPVATASQHKDVSAGMDKLASQTKEIYRRKELNLHGIDEGTGYFVGPAVFETTNIADSPVVNEFEVFGPAGTLIHYDGDAQTAADIVNAGGGGLVSSVYSDDASFLKGIVPNIAPSHGRIYLGSEKMAAQSPGPGTALPNLLHGGPGRAGGGEELGGERGVRFYQQRVALQGDQSLIKKILR